MKRILTFAALLTLAACGDKEADDSGTDDSTTDDSTTDDSTSEAPTAADVQAIVNSACAGCHVGGSSGGLNMDDVVASTVNVASSAGMKYVTPGDQDQSYLWHKINGTHTGVGGTGSKMPLSGTLSADDTTTIGDWIAAGAPE